MVLDELTEKMLRCLVEAEDSSITTSDLANEANMSISSIKSNLKNVKSIISSVGAKLISTPGIGIQIESTPEQLNKLKELIIGSAGVGLGPCTIPANVKENTRNMVAKIGRAARLGERSKGFLDAGATSCNIILQTIVISIKEILDNEK